MQNVIQDKQAKHVTCKIHVLLLHNLLYWYTELYTENTVHKFRQLETWLLVDAHCRS